MRSRFLKELASVVELPAAEPRRAFMDDGGYGSSYGGRGGYGRGYGGSSYGGYGRSTEDDDDNYVSYGNQSYAFTRNKVNAAVQRNGYGSSYGGSSGGYGSFTNGASRSAYGSSTNGASRSAYGSSTGSTGGATRSSYGSASGVKPKTAPQKDLSGFAVGVSVTHPKFGQGTIVGARGSGASMILDIAFAGLGIKQLSASLAPLDIVK